MNSYKVLALCAMISPFLYTLMWILGGIIVPGYSHIQDDVSSLFAIDANRRWLFQSLSIICSLLLLAFFVGLYWIMNGKKGSPVGPALLIASAVFGLLVACFFPLDAGGEPSTWRGMMHVILIALSGILLIAGAVLMYFRLRSVDGWQGFATFQLISAPVLLVLVVVMFPFTGGKYMGLVERFMVSGYQIYYFVSGLMVFLRS